MRHLTRPVKRVAATLSLLVALGATALTVAPSAAVAAGPQAPPVAQRIDLARSGGIAGTVRLWVVDTTNTHPDAAAALALAGTPEFRALERGYPPARWCCDRFQHNLRVSYADGSVKTVVTWDGAPAPEVLTKVLRLTRAVGTPPPA